MAGDWKNEYEREFWRIVDAGGGEIKTLVIPIHSEDKFNDEYKIIIRGYPDNQTVCHLKVKKLD